MSAMVLNQDHQVNRTFHEPGAHELSVDEFDTPYRLISKLRDTRLTSTSCRLRAVPARPVHRAAIAWLRS
jgi:hypothetical protein